MHLHTVDTPFSKRFLIVNSSGEAINADALPTATVIKNDVAVVDAVTVTDLTGSQVGLYSINYDPAGEVVGDHFLIVVNSVLSSSAKPMQIEFIVVDSLATSVAASVASGQADLIDSLESLVDSFRFVRSNNPQPSAEELELVQHDRHNGTRAAKLSWTTEKTYSGEAAKLVVYNSDGIHFQGSGTATGNDVVIDDIAVAAPEDLFRGDPYQAKLEFAVVVAGEETIQEGEARIKWRPAIA